MIPADQAHIKIAAKTDKGIQGKKNEDQYSVSAYQVTENAEAPAVFAIIADGIGGHRAGEVASAMAVESISRQVAESDASQPVETLKEAMIEASAAIFEQASGDEKKEGMGTTCVTAWLIGSKLYSASVGNSRLYLIRGGRLYQLNVDHTWVQEAVEAGALTAEQARIHPHANVIRRYLGSPVELEVDTRLRTADSGRFTTSHQGQELRPGDRLLLCSDGLNDMIPDAKILELARRGDLDDSVDALIEAANAAGGKDNITVVLMEVPLGKGLTGVWQMVKQFKVQTVVAYAGLAVIGLGILAALVIYVVELVTG